MNKEILVEIFKPNVIYEGILSCYDLNKKPHIASMGFSFDKDYNLLIRPFKDTLTYKYVSNNKVAVINVVRSPELFFIATYSEKIDESLLDLSSKFKLPKLKEANLYLEVSLQNVLENEIRPTFIMKIENIFARKVYEKPYTRAEFALIESLIHSTRIRVFKEQKLYDEVEKLLSFIEYYDKLIRRIAPNTEYEELINKINFVVEKIINEKNYDKDTS